MSVAKKSLKTKSTAREATMKISRKLSRCKDTAINFTHMHCSSFHAIYLARPTERIALIKHGVPATHVSALAKHMNMTQEFLVGSLGLSRATLNRKIRQQRLLSKGEAERVLGVDYLIGQIENMVQESGVLARFDAAKWLASWLSQPYQRSILKLLPPTWTPWKGKN